MTDGTNEKGKGGKAEADADKPKATRSMGDIVVERELAEAENVGTPDAIPPLWGEIQRGFKDTKEAVDWILKEGKSGVVYRVVRIPKPRIKIESVTTNRILED